MKIVAFNGSPRKNGNTEILLEEGLGVAEKAGIETELVHIGAGKVKRGCTACYACVEKKNGYCVFTDDIVNECVDKILAADAILLGSPVYFTDVTAEMKGLIDRAGYAILHKGPLLRRKIGASVVAQRRGGAVHTFDTMNHFFQISGMIIPGSTYWNFGVGLGIGEVSADEEAIRNMRDLGDNITWLLQSLVKK